MQIKKLFSGYTIRCLPLFICVLILIGVVSLIFVQAQQNDIQTQQTGRQVQILKGDYKAAKQALCEAVIAKDTQIIRLALKQSRFGPFFVSEAVKAIKQTNNKEFVADLINELERNQGIRWRGGTETEVEQKELSKNIVLTLETLTGLEFGTSKNLTPQEIELVINVSRQWWKGYDK